MKPKVTVMVANYNTSGYLAACLNSLLQQTYDDFEVLIIDDGSTDNSVEICESFRKRDDRFRIIKLDKNRGLTYVRHLGLQEAQGEYIAILDADDLSVADRLAKQVQYLDDHPETVLVGGYYGIIDENGKIRRKRKKVPINDLEIRWRLTFGNCLIHSTIMYRKEQALLAGGYDTAVLRGEDIELHSKLIAFGKAAALTEVVSFWRWHKKSMTQAIAAEEMDKYYHLVVQRAIQIHTKQTVDINVAAAAFYNTKRPAQSLEIFQKAIDVIINAHKVFRSNCSTKEDAKVLVRCILQHLFRLRKRNKRETWWFNGEANWYGALYDIIIKNKYRWYWDFNLFFPKLKFSIRNYLYLLKVTIKDNDI